MSVHLSRLGNYVYIASCLLKVPEQHWMGHTPRVGIVMKIDLLEVSCNYALCAIRREDKFPPPPPP